MPSKEYICLVLIIFPLILTAAFSPLEEGERLFMENKPAEALPLLLEALHADSANEKIYLYLGVIYEQLDLPEKAISILQRGLNIARDYQDLICYNIGNNFFRRGESSLAEDMYSKAIGYNAGFAEPYLNRANSRLKLEKYQEALSDYTSYLRLDPGTEQRSEIERMIGLLNDLINEQETRERERVVREKVLMNEILNSLKNASEDTQNLSTSSDHFLEEVEGEIDIED